jgi:phytoene dehydrogenase-like protein
MSELDGIIVGDGHPGLTCVAYPIRAGLRVAVTEASR